MSFTSILGTRQAQGSTVQLAAAGAQLVQIQWTGPFSPGEIVPGTSAPTRVYPGQTYSVSAADAARLEASDLSWWVIVG